MTSNRFGKPGWRLSEETPYLGLLEAQKREGQVTRVRKDDPVETWMDDANCAGLNPESFFPHVDQNKKTRNLTQERAVCANCGVRPECANYALKINATDGLWAGVVITADIFWRQQLINIAREINE